MKKKNRNPYSKVHDYSKYASKWNGVEIPSDDERYYGIHRDGNRVKIDIKRMKKIGTSGVPASVLDAASAIPRNTTYFLPKRSHRHDYVINQFRDKLAELTASWREYKTAFEAITSPTDVAEQVRLERLNSGLDDNEDATVAGIMSGARRQATYNKLWISQCAQFIHQMATELDALMLRKCVYETEQSSLTKKLAELEEAEASYDDERNSINDFIANANRFIDIQELTPEIVHAFISKIYVHEKKEKWSRTEGNDIDIVFTVGFREQHTVRTSDAIAS